MAVKKGPETATIQKLAVATQVSFAWRHEGIDEGGKDDDIAAIVTLLEQLEGRDRILIRGKIEAWVKMMLGNIPDADRRENTNLDRRNEKK